jgi:hypothetical protein
LSLGSGFHKYFSTVKLFPFGGHRKTSGGESGENVPPPGKRNSAKSLLKREGACFSMVTLHWYPTDGVQTVGAPMKDGFSNGKL